MYQWCWLNPHVHIHVAGMLHINKLRKSIHRKKKFWHRSCTPKFKTFAVPCMKLPEEKRKSKRRKGKGEVGIRSHLPIGFVSHTQKYHLLRQLPLCPKPFMPSKLLYYPSFLEYQNRPKHIQHDKNAPNSVVLILLLPEY